LAVVDLDAAELGPLIDCSIDIAQLLQLFELSKALVGAKRTLDEGQTPGLGLGLDVGAHGQLTDDQTGGEDHEDGCRGADEVRVHMGIIGRESAVDG